MDLTENIDISVISKNVNISPAGIQDLIKIKSETGIVVCMKNNAEVSKGAGWNAQISPSLYRIIQLLHA
jgi:hypothetical protein